MSLRYSLKGKLAGAFISLAFISLTLALFCGGQLLGIQRNVAKLNALAGNTTKVLEIANDLKAISASLLHYNDYGDEASLKESAAHEAQAITLLGAAAKATLSPARLATYKEVTAEIGDIGEKRGQLSDAVRTMLLNRMKLFKGGDDLVAIASKLIDASSNPDVDNLLQKKAKDIYGAVLLVRVANWRFLATQDTAGPALFKANLGKANQQIAAFEKIGTSEDLRGLLGATKAELNNYADAFDLTRKARLKSENLYNNTVVPIVGDSLEKISKAQASLFFDFETTRQRADDSLASTITLQLIITCLAVGLGVSLALFIARSISQPIQAMTKAMTALATGNLHAEIPGQDRTDEIGEMARSVNVFKIAATERLRLEEAQKRAEEALRDAQEELFRAGRLAILGELTASIAHEINQPLAGIAANGSAGLNWLNREEPDLDQARAALSRIVRDGTRASDVIQGLRGLANKSGPQFSLLNIDGVITEALALAGGELRRDNFLLQTQLWAGNVAVSGNRIQLQQVLLNLIMNSVEAMKDMADSTRELSISSTFAECSGVTVAVEDTGPGLDPAVAQHMFDPFFTTKADGLGMGLRICRSIVEAHGGRLWASQRAPRGAAIRFTLPVG